MTRVLLCQSEAGAVSFFWRMKFSGFKSLAHDAKNSYHCWGTFYPWVSQCSTVKRISMFQSASPFNTSHPPFPKRIDTGQPDAQWPCYGSVPPRRRLVASPPGPRAHWDVSLLPAHQTARHPRKAPWPNIGNLGDMKDSNQKGNDGNKIQNLHNKHLLKLQAKVHSIILVGWWGPF